MNKFTVKTIILVEEMIPQFELISQLSPNVSIDQYENMINDMVKLNYKQAVIYLGQKPVGVCGFWINTKIYCGKYIELDNVIIEKTMRGKNLGNLLCNYVFEIAKQNNCKAAMLDAYLDNTFAHNFYGKIGFIKKGFHFIKPL